MMMTTSMNIFLLLTFVVSSSSSSPTLVASKCGQIGGSSLRFVLFVFRHGDRTPYTTYPTDLHQVDAWVEWGGWGQLTQVGMQQHYEFGQWVRGCYSELLNSTYNPQDLKVRSTDYDRTLMSAEAHLAGAYPPHGFQQWGDGEVAKLWQPIPIHTMPKSEDYELRTDAYCPPYQVMIEDQWQNSDYLKKLQSDNQALLDYIAENAGLDLPGQLEQIQSQVCDSVRVERLKNMTLPDWMNETVQDKLEEWQDLWIDTDLANDEMVKWSAGALVYNIRQLLRNKTEHKITQHHYIYSAHDSTVGSLLAAYDDFNELGPPYRSAVITELHWDQNAAKHHVVAYYRNDTKADPYPLQIRGCSTPCWIDDFEKVLEPFTLTDKEHDCNTNPKPAGLDEGATIAIAVTSTAIIVLMFVTVVFLLLPLCRQKSSIHHVPFESSSSPEPNSAE